MAVTDPYILSGPREAGTLESFLRTIPVCSGAQIRVRANSPKPQPSREDFADRAQQDRARLDLESRYSAKQLKIYVPRNGQLAEHDRIILLHFADGRCYRVLLGYGLTAFRAKCLKRSEVAWFEIETREFEEEWRLFQ
jgi:hypothetical protein